MSNEDLTCSKLNSWSISAPTPHPVLPFSVFSNQLMMVTRPPAAQVTISGATPLLHLSNTPENSQPYPQNRSTFGHFSLLPLPLPLILTTIIFCLDSWKSLQTGLSPNPCLPMTYSQHSSHKTLNLNMPLPLRALRFTWSKSLIPGKNLDDLGLLLLWLHLLLVSHTGVLADSSTCQACAYFQTFTLTPSSARNARPHISWPTPSTSLFKHHLLTQGSYHTPCTNTTFPDSPSPLTSPPPF